MPVGRAAGRRAEPPIIIRPAVGGGGRRLTGCSVSERGGAQTVNSTLAGVGPMGERWARCDWGRQDVSTYEKPLANVEANQSRAVFRFTLPILPSVHTTQHVLAIICVAQYGFYGTSQE